MGQSDTPKSSNTPDTDSNDHNTDDREYLVIDGLDRVEVESDISEGSGFSSLQWLEISDKDSGEQEDPHRARGQVRRWQRKYHPRASDRQSPLGSPPDIGQDEDPGLSPQRKLLSKDDPEAEGPGRVTRRGRKIKLPNRFTLGQKLGNSQISPR